MIYQDFNSLYPYNYNSTMYQNLEYVEHLHDDFEVVYIIKGNVNLTVNGKLSELHEKDFAMILPNQIHSYITPEGTSLAWIGVFSKDYVKDFANETKGKEGAFSRFQCDDIVINFVSKYMIYAEHPTVNELSACLTILCAIYQRDNKFTKIKMIRENLLYNILHYISLHYTEDISLQNIADELHVNMNYLSRFFHKNIAMNFSTFINHYRVSHAEHMLAQNIEMADVAYGCGFRSIRTFNRAFKSITGYTPSAYKRMIER